MKGKEDKILKNKPALAAGIFSALFFILFGNELLQALTAYIFNADNVKINFYYFYVLAGYQVPVDFPAFGAYTILLMPVINSLILIQTGSFILLRVPLGFYRYSFMIFQLAILGYLLLYLLAGTLSVALRFDWNTDMQKFVSFLNIDYPANLFIVFIMIFIIALFVNFNAKRVSTFINK